MRRSSEPSRHHYWHCARLPRQPEAPPPQQRGPHRQQVNKNPSTPTFSAVSPSASPSSTASYPGCQQRRHHGSGDPPPFQRTSAHVSALQRRPGSPPRPAWLWRAASSSAVAPPALRVRPRAPPHAAAPPTRQRAGACCCRAQRSPPPSSPCATVIHARPEEPPLIPNTEVRPAIFPTLLAALPSPSLSSFFLPVQARKVANCPLPGTTSLW